MRAAIVHYWLLNMRGGERVVEALCRLLPDADIFTLFYAPDRVSPLIRERRVTASFLNPFRFCYRSLLPLMPLALEQFDLRSYDLVISSESGPAKGVLTSSTARHICYCHTPMRYLWELYPDYRQRWAGNFVKKAAMAPLASYLRLWDYATAARVDSFIANSENVRRRILKTYRRESEVVHPPVPVDTFYWKEPQDYFLAVSELVPYKRLDLAVRCCSRSGRRLRIVGDGPEYRRLRRAAGSTIEFCGRVSDTELRGLYAHSRALIMPGEEDFGMTAVESLASGKPVIALARGGVLESVPMAQPRCGILFREQNEPDLEGALATFEREERLFVPEAIQASARRFSEAAFMAKMQRVLESPSVTDL